MPAPQADSNTAPCQYKRLVASKRLAAGVGGTGLEAEQADGYRNAVANKASAQESPQRRRGGEEEREESRRQGGGASQRD
eukprot:1224928-Rhodomonas_salina.1